MASLLKWVRNAVRRAPSPPLRFPSIGSREIISDSELLEEEQFEFFKTGVYYPVNIGDVFVERYQIVGKLGFGTTSTVWLARDLQWHQHVALKVYTREGYSPEEFEVYQHMSKANPWHPGYAHVRTALDTFVLPRPGGDHHCLVQKPMWDSFRDLLYRNPTHRFTEDLLRGGLKQLLTALDYLHTDCKLVHADIKADNILQDIEDESILDGFVKAEMIDPAPLKWVNNMPIYMSRRFGRPDKFGGVVLSDFGEAVRGDERRNHDAQPDFYRSPEVMLRIDWSYPIDIWNVGVLIWDLFEGRHLFRGRDPNSTRYSTRAHLAEVIGMLGCPPLDLIHRGKRSHEFFTEDGQWKAEVAIPQGTSLEQAEEYLEGKNQAMFLDFVRGILQWRPEDRKTAKQLLQDPWLNNRI